MQQKYYWDNEHHDAVFACWKHLCEDSIGNLFRKRKRSGKKLDYTWETEVMVKKSKTESELVRLSHNGNDRSLVDKWATETLANQHSTSTESEAVSETGSTATGPSPHQPNAAYIEVIYHFQPDLVLTIMFIIYLSIYIIN